jgi:Protein of unknown function (DUF2865)
MKRPIVAVVAFSVALSAVPASSQAQGLFEALFGALGRAAREPARAVPQPFIFGDGRPEMRAPREMTAGGSGGAFCVRTCDGRYFPAPAAGGQSRADICNSFCPAGETKLFYGSNIDGARSADGRAYTALPNAFRFRNELVANCTCNGKDAFGLARIDINRDPTLRRGDIVASGDGLVVATGRVDRAGGANFSEISASVRASFAKMPVVAKE